MIVTGSSPFPFVTKDGSLESFKTITSDEFVSDFSYGDIISGSYPYSSGIKSDYFSFGSSLDRRKALKNTFNYYTNLSPFYSYQNDTVDKEQESARLISIPSIFYGQSIKKGSVDLKFFVTGTLIGRLQDKNQNGELIQTEPEFSNGIGNVAGVVLYNEGFVWLSGNWELSAHTEDYGNGVENPSWLNYMTTGSGGNIAVSSSFSLDFEGTEKIPVVTMFAKAEKGEFNHSNNQTYVEYGQEQNSISSSNLFIESNNLNIKNIVDSKYDEEDPPFEKITYISKIAIFDEQENLIGVAKLAKPIKKRQNDNIAFKLKLDL